MGRASASAAPAASPLRPVSKHDASYRTDTPSGSSFDVGFLAQTPSDRVPWAWLLRRVFLVEVLRCDRCGGRRDVLTVTGPVAVPRVLAHLGLPTTGPQPDGARAPPQTDWLAS